MPRGRVATWGWALDRLGPVAAVLVLVDGQVTSVLEADLPRPDVAAAHPDLAGAACCGWAAWVNLSQHSSATAELGIAVVRADGHSELRHSIRLRLARDPSAPGEDDDLDDPWVGDEEWRGKPIIHALSDVPLARIDHPESGQRVPRRPLAVWGRTLFRSGPAASVQLTLDGEVIDRARVGAPRADVADIPIVGAGISGFEALVDLSAIPAHVGEVLLSGTAHGVAGEILALEAVRLRLAPPEAPYMDDGEAARLRSRTPRSRVAVAPTGGHRLLAVTHHLGFGGGQLYLHELLRLLRRDSGVAAAVAAPTDGPLRGELESLGIPVHVCGPHPIGGVAEYEGQIHQLAAWAQHEGFTAVLVNTMLAFYGADLAERLNLPCVWAIHESMTLPVYWATAYPPGRLHGYVRQRGERALGRAQAVVFEADATRRDYQPYGDPRRFVVIPYGVDLDAIDRYRADAGPDRIRGRLSLEKAATVILCMGTFERRKAQTALLQAFAGIGDEATGAHLVLVGDTGGEYSRAVHAFVEEAGLKARVTIVPVVQDTYPWYSVADLLVCASDVESLPRSVLEVMAFEKPVLATAVYGLPELIEHGRNGWLCPPRDVAALRDGLVAALQTAPERRAAIGRAAREVVRARYDSRGYARDYLRLLDALRIDPGAFPRDVLG